MIARLSVAPESIRDLGGQLPPIAAKAQHETFLRAVEAHGLLVVANADEEQDLVREARQLGADPPGAKERWLMALTELKKRKRVRYITPPIESGLDTVEGIGALRKGWGGRAQVAVLASDHAAAIGVQRSGLLMDHESKLEIAAAPVAAYCETLNLLRDLAEQGELAHGAPRNDFWRQVLMPLAVLSRRVVVLDQYLFGEVTWHHTNLPRSRDWQPEVVVWLLNWLDRTLPNQAQVTLIGGCGGDRGPRNAADAAAMIRDVWRPNAEGRLGKVEVVAGPWRQGEIRMPHDRHVRFSVGGAIKSLPGFDRLGRTTVQDLDGMGWQYRWKAASLAELHAAETRVMRGSQSGVAMALDRS